MLGNRARRVSITLNNGLLFESMSYGEESRGNMVRNFSGPDFVVKLM